jgi:hypothetical protein
VFRIPGLESRNGLVLGDLELDGKRTDGSSLVLIVSAVGNLARYACFGARDSEGPPGV